MPVWPGSRNVLWEQPKMKDEKSAETVSHLDNLRRCIPDRKLRHATTIGNSKVPRLKRTLSLRFTSRNIQFLAQEYGALYKGRHQLECILSNKKYNRLELKDIDQIADKVGSSSMCKDRVNQSPPYRAKATDIGIRELAH